MIKNNKKGFTLIELLVVLAIIGIVISLAYPAYSHHVIKARRVEAQVALLDLAARMEQYYSENNHSYKNVTLAELKFNETTENSFYTLAITDVTPTAYVLLARPLGVQARHDTACATLMLNQLGQKSATGIQPAECW